MKFHRMYALSLRHIYLIKGSLPRILDLIYWPTIQIVLWGFISKFFTLHTDLYNHTVGIILSSAILYDFLFRSSISFNMLFLEEIWSRNFTNLFVAPLKVSEIITALTATALLRTLIGIIPAILLATPFFGVSIFTLGPSLILLFLSLYLFGITLGLLVTSGLLRYGPAFENLAWSSLFLLAPLGCVYYPLSILPDWLQVVAKILPLVYIFEEVRSILLDNVVNYSNILTALKLNLIYFASAVSIFYLAFYGARKKGTLINVCLLYTSPSPRDRG